MQVSTQFPAPTPHRISAWQLPLADRGHGTSATLGALQPLYRIPTTPRRGGKVVLSRLIIRPQLTRGSDRAHDPP